MPTSANNLWDAPNLFLQKFSAPTFTVTTKVDLTSRGDQYRAGLIVMGLDYAYIALRRESEDLYVYQAFCKDADKRNSEAETGGVKLQARSVYLRVTVKEGAVCNFTYSVAGKVFHTLGAPFQARQGKWIGAKVGIFTTASQLRPGLGYADFNWFRVEQ